MNDEQQIKIQAYLDGELSAHEAKEMADLLAKDSEARLLFGELQMMKTVLAGNELELKMPESREFFWSKVQREIRLQEKQAERKAVPEMSLFGWLQRYLVPIGAAAAVAFIAMVSITRSGSFQSAAVGQVETLNEEMGSISFRSESDRMTVIYLYDRTAE